jgi:hypothetical protein
MKCKGACAAASSRMKRRVGGGWAASSRTKRRDKGGGGWARASRTKKKGDRWRPLIPLRA